MNNDNVSDLDWEIPVHRSLVKPLYWMGVPRGLLIAEAMLAILGGVIFKTFLVPLIIIGCHFVFRYLGQKDSMFLDVFFRYVRHSNFYR